MNEPLTIYVCPECGHVDAYEVPEPCHGCYDEDDDGRPHDAAVPVPVRVFRETDVRPLWEAAHNTGAWRAFPAPEDWR